MYPSVQSWDHFYLTLIYVTSFLKYSNLEYASFADDTTPYICLPEMIPILEKLAKVIQSTFD